MATRHSGSQKRKLVQGCESALEQMKYEIAEELGLSVGRTGIIHTDVEFADELGTIQNTTNQAGDWGQICTRDAGFVGGTITARLIGNAQQLLAGK